MIYLNLNKGIVGTITDNQVTIHHEKLSYGVMQDVLGRYLNKGINFINVKNLIESEKNNLKNRGMFSDGEIAFIENVEIALASN
jgi:hypothetical protein